MHMYNLKAEEIVAKFSPKSKEKNTLYWLASFCDYPTKIKPCGFVAKASVEKIALRAGISERTAQRHLRELEARRAISISYMGSGYRVNSYQIEICKLLGQGQLKLPLVSKDEGRQFVTLKGDIVTALRVTDCHPSPIITPNLNPGTGASGLFYKDSTEKPSQLPDGSNFSTSEGEAFKGGEVGMSAETQKIWDRALKGIANSLRMEGTVARGRPIPVEFSVDS